MASAAEKAAQEAAAASSKKGEPRDAHMGNDDDERAQSKRSRLHQAKGSDYKPIKLNQNTINVILLKSTLQNMQNIRDLLCFLWQYTIAKSTTIVKKMKAAGQEYDTAVKKKRKGHGLGPPCITAFEALILALTELGSEVIGEEPHRVLSAFHKTYMDMNLNDKTMIVGICAFRKLSKEPLNLRMMVMVGPDMPETVRQNLRKALNNTEAVMLLGKPAASGLEYIAQDILLQLTEGPQSPKEKS